MYDFSDFAGLLLLVVFAVRSAVNHQLEWEKVGMWDIPERTLEKYTSGPSEMSVQIYYKMYLKNATDSGFLPSLASLAATSARSLYFE